MPSHEYPIPNSQLTIGAHRPVYLWAGPGTVRMNRLKFMDAPVDEAVHAEAHTPAGAQRMSREAAFTWAYLVCNWGFPPESEREDWEDFGHAVEVYHAESMRVFGYAQTSNCVYDGSFRDKDWYALDPRGRPFYYYTGRYMTCWIHPGWLEHLRGIVRGIVEAGADGVFFDNPWHGIQPLHLGGTWMGQAGCYCSRCRTAFREAAGLEIPDQISPGTDEASRHYVRWRADQVTGTLAMLASYARSLNPGVLVSANDFDAVMRPSYLVYGIDLHALARVQDLIMIEDYGLPRWEGSQDGAPVLVNNALTLRTARVGLLHPGDALWQHWDRLAPLYFGAGQSLLAAGVPWRVVTLARHVTSSGPPASLDGAEGSRETGTSPDARPAGSELAGLDLLLCFDERPPGDLAPPGLRRVFVPDLPGWAPPPPSFLARHRSIRSATSNVVSWLFQSYFRWRWSRQLVDWLGLVHLFWQTPFFRLPPLTACEALLAALGEKPSPLVMAGAPVLAELWQRGEERQLHLVNYSAEPQPVTVEFGRPVHGTALSPDGGEGGTAFEFQGASWESRLDVYTVLQYQADGPA